MRVAIVHTPTSLCTCHLAVVAACERFGHESVVLDGDALPSTTPSCDVLFDTCAGYRDLADWRWYPRAWAEERGIKIVGSPSSVLRVCDNKALGKAVMLAAGVPVPRGMLVPCVESESALAARMHSQNLQFPLIVKPVNEQGSTGLALVSTLSELRAAVAQCAAFASCAALVEEYVEGAEFELSIISGWPDVLPVIELAGLNGLNDQAAKSAPDHGLKRVPATLDTALSNELARLAASASTALGIRDFVRFDLRIRQTDAGPEPVFLEANAKPSFEPEFGLDRALQAGGKSVLDAIEHLIRVTSAREA